MAVVYIKKKQQSEGDNGPWFQQTKKWSVSKKMFHLHNQLDNCRMIRWIWESVWKTFFHIFLTSSTKSILQNMFTSISRPCCSNILPPSEKKNAPERKSINEIKQGPSWSYRLILMLSTKQSSHKNQCLMMDRIISWSTFVTTIQN